ncbi:ComEC/Rec2 family competence protein [Ruegeria sp. SCSIO 43209]|uniref:ComEC/Rec2 family competence protein n=1 Tax=Ruegeria sp. SCSIO 43209 TaxID=2793010 RepID=UPI001CA9216D|nr:ComEC/Rec2 family competence protein [Ruegeria sp. SCSIO 43209]UAB90285.1 ComEC/Rec2 family competence protein [Ruegeria sp. SCSIO 43209]
MRVLTRVETALLTQRGHLFPWSPICLAVGIGWYFSLRFEPEVELYVGVLALALLALASTRFMGAAWSPLATGLALIAMGFALAGARAHMVAEPVLQWRYYGPVEGRVVALDRSASDALRVTLDQVRIGDVPADQRPRRIRLSIHGESVALSPGQRIMTTAHLSPPQGPVEPGGFDFRRHAWFQQLGAVGYTRVPVLTSAAAQDGLDGVRITAWRMEISDRVRTILPGEVGGFAAAVTTGDRSGMGQASLEALRASNLAHLLAISGLHMGLLTGFVFVACRMGFSMVPVIALRMPVRKVAALCALFASTIYLLLSGGNVATERAFVMVCVMLGAVLLDRRAISLRAVAMAALIVLTLRPETLLSPGFQMSFAATTALVAGFGALRDYGPMPGPKWLRPVLALLTSSAIAGIATAPIGAAHFNAISHYGLLANLVSVPVMGTLVVPSAVVAALLAPFGLEAIALHVMGLGLRWILTVANWVAGLEGARGYVVSPDYFVLPVLALSLLWLMLWQGHARWLGIAPAALAIALWGQGSRPDVLIADTGGLVGVMTEHGRALSKPKGSGFVASVWLENDGDGADQPKAALRWPEASAGIQRFLLGDKELVHLTGKRAASAFQECRKDQIIVAPVSLTLTGECSVYDTEFLRKTGSLALSKGRLFASSDISGRRLWSPKLPQ